MSRTKEQLEAIYSRMAARFGPQHWWPADSPFEVMVGAVLTQNTNWGNVEKALDNLKRAGLLSFAALSSLPVDLLAAYIRPAGYYNIKAGRLRNLFALVNEQYGGDLEAFLAQPPEQLRERLLGVKGIGPETADSIVLYAAGQPVFVVDAYTHRILSRHGLIDEDGGYADMQALFMDHLPAEAPLYNEYHALLVRVGKEYCKKKNPACAGCPLEGL